LFNSINNDVSCDILIIGGGLAGLLTAKELNDGENEIIVVEKNTVGSGRTSVGKDVVFTDGGISIEKREDVNVKKLTEEFTALIEELEKITKAVGEKSFKRRGSFIFSDKPKDRPLLKRRFTVDKFSDIESFFLTSDEPSADFSFDFDSAVYSEFGGATLNAVSFAEKLASYLSLNGTNIAENTEIKSLVPSAEGFTAKTEQEVNIKAKTVIDTRCGGTGKKAVFSAKTKPVGSFTGWPQGCIIRDTYKNRMTFFQTETQKIGMTFEKQIILPQIFGTEHNFEYMQQILSSMFFAIPETMFNEKATTVEERHVTKQSGIYRSDDFKDLYIFRYPYSNGILSAINGAKRFASMFTKRRK